MYNARTGDFRKIFFCKMFFLQRSFWECRIRIYSKLRGQQSDLRIFVCLNGVAKPHLPFHAECRLLSQKEIPLWRMIKTGLFVKKLANEFFLH